MQLLLHSNWCILQEAEDEGVPQILQINKDSTKVSFLYCFFLAGSYISLNKLLNVYLQCKCYS